MSLKLQSLTLNTPHLAAMLAFYQAIGLELKASRVDKGGEVYQGKFADLDFSLFSIAKQQKLATPDLALRFVVVSLDQCEVRLKQLQSVHYLMQKTEMPYGKVMIVLDPDGRSVELVEQVAESEEN